jgi:IclR family KDG regulon transcriptional repressor
MEEGWGDVEPDAGEKRESGLKDGPWGMIFLLRVRSPKRHTGMGSSGSDNRKFSLTGGTQCFRLKTIVHYRKRILKPHGCEGMKVGFKRVPAVEKCFNILDLLARSGRPLGISDISKALGYHKGTVFNILYTLVDLGVIGNEEENRFRFGTKLYLLGKASGQGSELIRTVHPYLEEVNKKTQLSAFLGIRSGLNAVIIDKVDMAFDIRIHSEIGMRIPLLAGAGGKALLSQMSDADVDLILSRNELKRFTPHSCVSKKKFKELIKKTRKEGVAIDKEEYIEGIRALAVPLDIKKKELQAAIWAIGLKRHMKDKDIPSYSRTLRDSAKRIEDQFSF